MITRYEFELLCFLERNGKRKYSQRELSDSLKISGTEIKNSLDILINNDYIENCNNTLQITKKGIEALEPYRVKRAVVFAAGFGSRMVPVTLDTPKPLVRVNGIRIIDTLLDALITQGITDITIVCGYKKEKFKELLEKYPNLKLVDNDIYDQTNNISSAIAALNSINQCYICEADLLITNPYIIRKYEFCSNYLGSYSLETDDWCFDMEEGCAKNYRKGGKYCFNAYGISYWSQEDSKQLREDLKTVFESTDGKDVFWEFIPLDMKKENYNVEIRQCKKADIMEIDNFYELVQLDSSYENYSNN